MRHLQRFWQWLSHTSWKKRLLILTGLVVLVIIFKNVFFANKSSKYTFDTVNIGTITQLVTETGNIIASDETDVFSPTTGELGTIYVKNGDQVKKGDKLLTVVSTATSQEQATAYANYLNAVSAEKASEQNQLTLQSQLEQARQQVITASGAVDTMNNNRGTDANNPATNKAYTQDDIDSINSGLTSARENFTAIEKKYTESAIAIGAASAQNTSAYLAYQATQNSTITAPSAGTIANLIGVVGTKVTAQINSAATSVSTSTLPVTPVLILGNGQGLVIQTTVSEVDINKIALNQLVNINFSAIPNQTFSGHVIQIDTYGTNNAGVITFNVFILIDNPDPAIKPGMTANLTINTAAANNVLTVANSAVVPYQNGKAVQVLGKNNQVKFIPISIGLRGFTRSQIMSGVPAGTKVILGNTQLTNNMSGGPGQNQ